MHTVSNNKRKLPAFLYVVAAVILFAAWSSGNKTAHDNSTAPSITSVNAAQAASPAKNAPEAAEIGDIVRMKYPTSTIMCTSSTDVFTVFLAGRMAENEEYRLTDNAQQALEAGHEARKQAMRTAYTCRWAKRDIGYRVTQKEIIGTEADAFHVVKYCVRAADGATSDECQWLEQGFTEPSMFNK